MTYRVEFVNGKLGSGSRVAPFTIRARGEADFARQLLKTTRRKLGFRDVDFMFDLQDGLITGGQVFAGAIRLVGQFTTTVQQP